MSSRNGDGSRYSDERIRRLKALYSIHNYAPFKHESPLVQRVSERINWIRSGDVQTAWEALREMLKLFVTLEWRVEDLEREAGEDARAISRLYDHLTGQQEHIRCLVDQVDNLRARLAVMENREAERVALSAVESYEEDGDLEAMLDNLGRPESMKRGDG